MHTNINIFLNIGPGAEGGRKKKEVKSSSLPYTFDNDCTLQLEQAHKSICINILNWEKILVLGVSWTTGSN